MMGVEQVRMEREAREASAAATAAKIKPGDYYADGNCVKSHVTGEIIFEGISHWDACAVMLAIPKEANHG